MSQPLDSAWESLLLNLKKQISPQSYETWFAPTKQLSADENSISVEVPNKFFKDWLLEHYKEQLVRATESFQEKKLDIKFIVSTRAQGETPEEASQEKKGFGFFGRSFERFAQPQDYSFNKKYTLEDFVVGGCNRFAHAAALAVSENPAKAYNPLFIYGGVGLGKTHLMQAVAQHIIKKQPRLKVMYVSSEKFTNQLIGAIQNRTTQRFREKHRHLDVLLIDDIQFLSGKESTQEEFFHTFNALYDAHKQIIVSSDRPPKEIASLEGRLVSRFEWGLVTDVQAPDFETRIAILRKKLEKETVLVPDDVLFFIAEQIQTNVRELEGALIRVAAYSSLVGHRVDMAVAKEVLKEVAHEKFIEVGVERIQQVAADYFGVTTNDMRTKKRTKKVVYPRQVAMYLSRELTKLSLVEIGGLFGGRDHTTIIHAYDKIEEDIKKNPHIKGVIDNIITKIKSGS